MYRSQCDNHIDELEAHEKISSTNINYKFHLMLRELLLGLGHIQQ